MLGEFGWFYSLSPERKAEESNGVLTEPHFAWPMFASTMMAFAGRVRNDQAISQRAWQLLLDNDKSGVPLPIEATIEAATTWKKNKRNAVGIDQCVGTVGSKYDLLFSTDRSGVRGGE